MAIKPKKTKRNEAGSAMLITTILLLTLSVMVGAAMNIASRQYDLALLTRNTSNTYYLAKSAAEKQVDAMNKSIELEMTHLLQELSKTYIDNLINKEATILYQSGKIQVDNNTIKEDLQNRLHEYISSNYVGKTITYKVSSDRAANDYATTMTIQTEKIYQNKSPVQLDKKRFKLIVMATTMNEKKEVYDKQIVESIIKIDLPNYINNEIYEKYAWNPVTHELFQSAILSSSDIVVSGSGKLKVTVGDVRVGGPQDIARRSDETYPEVDENGGVIAINGGEIEITDNLYCTNNVVVTNGWNSETREQSTSIEVGGDIIAYTVGILDDYFSRSANQSPFNPDHQVTGTSIKVGRNIMVDNDVMIDRWVKNSKIEVGKSIFGVSDGVDLSQSTSTDNSVADVNPNQSSGVFSQGSNSQIVAQRMYVAGQPYITLQTGQKPLKLWESIGEPFNGIASFGGYATKEELPINRDYLLEGSPFYEMIADDKIITDFTQTYAVAKVSGINTTAGAISSGSIGTGKLKGEECKAIFTTSTGADNQTEAMKFFYQGGSAHKFSEFISGDDTQYTSKVQNIIQNIGDYYAATKEGYFRPLNNPPSTNYKGLRGYMTLMRAPLYKTFSANVPTQRLFSDAVNMERLPSKHIWSYETPIEVIDASKVIDISKFYVDEDGSGAKPYPSIIINKDSSATLTLAASGGKEFRGIIISAGPIKVLNDINVTGSMVIGDFDITNSQYKETGQETEEERTEKRAKKRMAIFQGEQAGLIVDGATLTVDHKPEELFNITAKDQSLYRATLDALYLTDYSKQSLNDIMGKQGEYTKPALKYTDKSVLEVDTKGIQIVIESLKKVQ